MADNPKGYEYIDHTADLKVKSYGKTIEEAFINAAKGGFDFLIDTNTIDRRIEKKIRVSSKRLESLLYDFLEELLFLLDSENFLFCEAKKMVIKQDSSNDDFSLECTILGDNCKKYHSHGDIKAITYSDMKIEQGKDKVMVQVVFDI